MKKCVLIVAVAIFGYAFSAKAQSCVISGANDGSSAEIQSCFLQGNNKVIVNVINDSKDIAANVTVEVTVTYKHGNSIMTQQYSRKDISIARVPLKIEIPIAATHPKYAAYVASSVTATKISGAKCK